MIVRHPLLILLILALVAPAAADEPASSSAPPGPHGVRVVWTTDPCREAIVVWDTDVVGADHYLTLRKQSPATDETQVDATTGEYSYRKKDDPPAFHHRAFLRSLAPATTYEVQVTSDRQSSPWLHFDTAPSDGRPFSLVFGGDSRTGLQNRQKINLMLAQLTKRSWQAEDTGRRIYALAHGGDYVFFGTSAQQWRQWRTDQALTTNIRRRLLPIIPARGNHDRGRLFAETFGLDYDDGNYYGLSFGGLLRFITLNTEVSIAGDQADWLREELSRARPAHRWLVAQYHRPAYPAVKSPSGALVHWVPLFEQYNVHLVCEADGHNIKRTLPIRNGTYHPDGVVYIGEGGLGVPQRSPKLSRWFLRSPGFADSGHHVHVLRFSDTELTVACRLLNGQTRDTFTRGAGE